MRFPSFIKIPEHRKFEITPRYYDPVKEEIEERTAKIKAEMQGGSGAHAARKISFERRASSPINASMMQMMIAVILGLGILGWLYLGDVIFNVLWLAVPAYLYYRFRKSSRTNR